MGLDRYKILILTIISKMPIFSEIETKSEKMITSETIDHIPEQRSSEVSAESGLQTESQKYSNYLMSLRGVTEAKKINKGVKAHYTGKGTNIATSILKLAEKAIQGNASIYRDFQNIHRPHDDQFSEDSLFASAKRKIQKLKSAQEGRGSSGGIGHLSELFCANEGVSGQIAYLNRKAVYIYLVENLEEEVVLSRIESKVTYMTYLSRYAERLHLAELSGRTEAR